MLDIGHSPGDIFILLTAGYKKCSTKDSSTYITTLEMNYQDITNNTTVFEQHYTPFYLYHELLLPFKFSNDTNVFEKTHSLHLLVTNFTVTVSLTTVRLVTNIL